MCRIVGMRTVEIKLTEKILLIGQVIEWTSHVTHVVRLAAKQNDQIPKAPRRKRWEFPQGSLEASGESWHDFDRHNHSVAGWHTGERAAKDQLKKKRVERRDARKSPTFEFLGQLKNNQHTL